MSKTTLPTFFSVSRAIQYSDGLLTAVMPDGSSSAVDVREFSVRGAKSSHGDAYKLAGGDAKVTKDINSPNPQVVDGAFLPFNSNRLRLSFSMNVIPVTTEQQACNDFTYTERVRNFLAAFKDNGGFTQIAKLLVWRIANASVLWRNRYGVDKTVIVRHADKSWTFNADGISTRTPEGFDQANDLAELIANALAGTTGVLMLSIDAEVTIGDGQEVFPSQELEMKKEKNGKSKKLYAIPYRGGETAAMHPQKLGAAIRAFDIWHPEFDKAGPLSIEPLGYSHQHQYSFRTVESGTDLYAYLENIEALTEELQAGTVTHQSVYLTACFMRGGVFSGSVDAAEKARKLNEKRAAAKKPKSQKNADVQDTDEPQLDLT